MFNFHNNSILRGTVNVNLSVSEDSTVSYTVNNEASNSFFAEGGRFFILEFEGLKNGTYRLNITIKDIAENINNTNLVFSVFTSAFNWNWPLIAEQSQTIDFIDANETYWFTFTITSRTDQSFNLTFLTSEDAPSLESNMLFRVSLSCERPDEIIFLTLFYPLKSPLITENQSFPVYNWMVWDELEEKWGIPDAHYNQVAHAWEITINSFSPYFALIETESLTRLRSVEVGGGWISSFELPLVIITLIVLNLHRIKRTRKKGE